MRLSQWIAAEGLTDAQAARRLGVSGPSTVARYKFDPETGVGQHRERRRPSPDLMVRIYVESGGRVTPNDFYDLPALPEQRQQAAA